MDWMKIANFLAVVPFFTIFLAEAYFLQECCHKVLKKRNSLLY